MASKPQFVGEKKARLTDLVICVESGKRERGGALSGGIPSLGGEHLNTDGTISWCDKKMKYVSPSFYAAMKKGHIQKNDVLVVKDGATTGKIAFVDHLPMAAAINEHLFLLRFSSELMAKYVAYFLMSAFGQREISKFYKGTAIGGIGKSFTDIKVTLHNDEDMLAIVAELDTIRNQITTCRSLIDNLSLIVKSRFVEMFGTAAEPKHPVVELESVCSAIVDCPHETPKYEGELVYPAIRTSELQNAAIEWSTMRYVSAEEYQKRIKRLKPLPGDIVYAREGTYGEAVMLPPGFEFCLGQRTMLFRANKEMCIPEYLLHSIVSADVKRQADELNVGSTVPHVNVRDAKRFKIMLPSKTDQQEFADFVAQVDKPRFVAHGGSYLVQENRHLPRGSSVSPSFSKACFMS